jgi:hypothetical protein
VKRPTKLWSLVGWDGDKEHGAALFEIEDRDIMRVGATFVVGDVAVTQLGFSS